MIRLVDSRFIFSQHTQFSDLDSIILRGEYRIKILFITRPHTGLVRLVQVGFGWIGLYWIRWESGHGVRGWSVFYIVL